MGIGDGGSNGGVPGIGSGVLGPGIGLGPGGSYGGPGDGFGVGVPGGCGRGMGSGNGPGSGSMGDMSVESSNRCAVRIHDADATPQRSEIRAAATLLMARNPQRNARAKVRTASRAMEESWPPRRRTRPAKPPAPPQRSARAPQRRPKLARLHEAQSPVPKRCARFAAPTWRRRPSARAPAGRRAHASRTPSAAPRHKRRNAPEHATWTVAARAPEAQMAARARLGAPGVGSMPPTALTEHDDCREQRLPSLSCRWPCVPRSHIAPSSATT